FQIVNMVSEGKNVKKGETLISFDAQRLMEDLQKYQNDLDQATKELEKTKVQIDLEQQNLAAKLAAAENNYEKLKLRQGSTPDVVAVREIKLDEIALEQAKREYEKLIERIEWHKRSSEATYNIIASKKARAQNQVSQIQQGLESFQAKADRDGVVIYKQKWNREKFQVGENVYSGQPVLEIPDLNTLLAEAYIPEVDIGKVKVGQRAEVAVDAMPGKTYTGTVKSIGTLVRAKAWDIPNKILEVQITLDQLNITTMRPAMSIKAKLETRTISNCIAVPLKAVRTTAAGTMVKIKTDAGWQEHPIKLGESNGNDVIIIDGLKPGDRIASDFAKAK
ncbi:MAG: efflux RND transporter periplasmic adaptor subunit, partial [Acidobacteriota bacterium]